MKYNPFLSVLTGAMIVAPGAYAALSITNGGFEANLDEDVADWFDPSNGTFWQGTWPTDSGGVTPNGTIVAVLGSYESGGIQSTASADAQVGNYVYQSIGTADGATSIEIGFDWGAPNDDPGGRELGMTVGVYAYDGLGGFTADNNTDIHGATGITLLDFQSFSQTSTGVDGLIGGEIAVLDLTGAGSQEVFLRFNAYRPGDTESWPVLDNVAIVPEPSVALLGGLGLLGLLRRRR